MKIVMLWIAALQIARTTSFTSSLKSGIVIYINSSDCFQIAESVCITLNCLSLAG
jgi:membrane protein insertase Oxa1/YidC/SpoIIIJ